MSIVDYIPGARGLEAIAFAAVVTFVGGVYVKQLHDVHAAQAALKTEQAAHTADLAQEKATADAATIARQATTIQRTNDQREIDNETERLETRNRDAAVRAAAVDPGLRSAFAASVASRRGGAASDPAASGDGQAIAAAGLVQSDVFGRVDDAAGDLAKAFDEAYARGLSCERKYGTLK